MDERRWWVGYTEEVSQRTSCRTEPCAFSNKQVSTSYTIKTISLSIATIISRRSGLVLERVDSIHTRLDRLDVVYEFVSNLLLHTDTKVISPSLPVSVERNSTECSLHFEVWVELPGHLDRKRCCPHGSFASGWLGSFSNNRSCRLFQCNCEHMCRSAAEPCNESGPHQHSLNFSCGF